MDAVMETVLTPPALEAPDLEGLAARLRSGTPAVVARIADGRLVVDLRSVDPEEDELLAEALLRARGESGGARNVSTQTA